MMDERREFGILQKKRRKEKHLKVALVEWQLAEISFRLLG